MIDEDKDIEQLESIEEATEVHHIKHLSGMFKEWFLDYASYVILERAVPYVNDGLKPVQRRILHTMKEMEDGRYNKVANLIGSTMKYHPHGDASIGDALVQLGQKDLLVDTQGNWGNILTGDRSAAPRYIEARLTKFALEVMFNAKTTVWQSSYDGRNREPITLPVKFPLLLAQGVEGIAVGLASKILPHNFIELIDASILHLKNKPFELFPDFATGGLMDASRYNDGLRGGNVRVRAKIEKVDNKTLAVREIPFSKTTGSLIESILKAGEKGKIKIKKVDDNTAAEVEILIHLGPNVSSDQTIDALYAFSDCEVSISPNACIIEDDKPKFIGVSEILRTSVGNTKMLLTTELEIRKSELEAAWHYASLEKIFIEERIYKDKEFEQAKSMDKALAHIDKRLIPFKPLLKQEITKDHLLRLMEIKMARILKFNSDKAQDILTHIEEEIASIEKDLENITQYTINYYKNIKKKYGKGRERKTELIAFDNIEAAKVVIANQKLYFDKAEGFVGTALKGAEQLCECSDLDDIIVFRKDGSYFVNKVSEKQFIGKNILHIDIFKRNDKRTTYNLVYRNGDNKKTYMKRFFVSSIVKNREYFMTKGGKGTKVLYFSANKNGEAEELKVTLKPDFVVKKLVIPLDLANLAIKGRDSLGNIVTKHDVHKVTLKAKGVSTLGGQKIWFDHDICRLNTDEHGDFLGEFSKDDKVLVIYQSGDFELTDYSLQNHYDRDIAKICKFNQDRFINIIYKEKSSGTHYGKRFLLEPTLKNRYSMVMDSSKNELLLLSLERYPAFRIEFGKKDKAHQPLDIDVAEFINQTTFRAKGKKVTSLSVAAATELDPIKEDDTPSNDYDSSEESPIDKQTVFDL